MRRYVPPVPRRTSVVRLVSGSLVAAALALTTLSAQIPGRNINMVAGNTWPDGDPYLQRQNEPSIAASTRNPLHLLAGANDYRTVDIPGLTDDETGDAWLGVFKSFDGGQRWRSTLLPGYPQDLSAVGLTSPIHGYGAGADAVVRAGTNGLMYYAGLAFDRSNPATPDVPGKSAIFVARYIDNNNKEAGDPFEYLGTRTLQTDPGGITGNFLDKPWMVVDVPRDSSRCTIVTPGEKGPITQSIPAGPVYVAYTLRSTDSKGPRYDVFFTRSTNCGDTWTTPVRLNSTSERANQGATLAIDPRNGNVVIVWRQFDVSTNGTGTDALMASKFTLSGNKIDPPGFARKFAKPKNGKGKGLNPEHFYKKGGVNKALEAAELSPLDQSTSALQVRFRTNAYPSMAMDETGRIYLAWAERGYDPLNPDPVLGSARVLMATSGDGKSWSAAQPVSSENQKGHQLMPSLTYAGGKLMLIYYDIRETRSKAFTRYIDDRTAFSRPDPNESTGLRHTIDLRASMASPGATPVFAPSVAVSEYIEGPRVPHGPNVPLQVNPPNLPMFQKGTAPFIGDYVDITAAPNFVLNSTGKWVYNSGVTTTPPVFHAAWTDNRDVRVPLHDQNGDGNPWNDYVPPGAPGGLPSIFDPSKVVQQCIPGNAGSRNQNVYTARITGGLLAGSPGNTKRLGYRLDESGQQTTQLMQRSFVVFAQNTGEVERRFRMSIANQPAGGSASFDQFVPLTVIEADVPRLSTASRTVYATSTDPHASVTVNVAELELVNNQWQVKTGGLGTNVVLNPDIDNPDIDNPDIDNPDIDNPDIDNLEVSNPDIDNPDIDNPDIDNPDIDNPDIDNPDIDNIRVANPDIDNPDIDNPDIDNPDIDNPDIDNPDIDNPDIDNASLMTDVSWSMTNTGNTTAAYSVNLFFAQQTFDPSIMTQLILYRTYKTPVVQNCDLKSETRNVLIANVPNPQLVRASTGEVSDANDSDATNATIYLAPGESAKITLRVFDPSPDPGTVVTVTNEDGSTAKISTAFVPNEDVTPVVQQQSVDTEDVDDGVTEAPIVVQFPAPQTVPDVVATAELTPVRVNVLANDSTAFGSTKILSLHPAGMATHSGAPPGDVTFQPSTGYLYTQTGVVDPATNALVGRLGYPANVFSVGYQQSNPRTGINYQRSNGSSNSANNVLSAVDARPDSPTFHQYLPMPSLAGSVFAFAIDSVHARLYVLHADAVQTVSSASWLTAIDINPTSGAAFHQVIYSVSLPAGSRGLAAAVNTRTNKVYFTLQSTNGGVFIVDGASNGPVATKIPGTFAAQSVAVNEANNQVFATMTLSGNNFGMWAIDGLTNAFTQIGTNIPMRYGSADERLAVHHASGKVLMRLENTVVIIDGQRGSPTRNTVLAVIPVGTETGQTEIAIDQELGLAVTVGNLDFRADVIDISTNSLASPPSGLPLNAGPTDVTIDPVLHKAFVSITLTSVQVLDLAGATVGATIPVFVESSGGVINPGVGVGQSSKIYSGIFATGGSIGKFSGAGFDGYVTGVSAAGRYRFGGRHTGTNRFFISDQGNAAGTSYAPGSVVVLDGATDAVMAQLTTPPNPIGIGIDQVTNRVYIGVAGAGTTPVQQGGIRIFDATDLGAPPIDATFSPDFPTYSSTAVMRVGSSMIVNQNGGRKLYAMVSNSPASALVLDPATNEMTALDGVAGTPLFDAAAAAGQNWGRVETIRVHHGLNRIYFGMNEPESNTSRIVAMDGTTHQIVGSVIAGEHSFRHAASFLVVNQAQQTLYVTNYTANTVTMLNAATLAPIGTPVALPAGPSATAFNVSANRLYVSSIDSKHITALDGTTLEILSTVRLPLVAYFLVIDEIESRLYASGGDSSDESGVMVVTDILGQLGTDVSVTSVGNAANGSVFLNPDHSVTYTPNLGFSGLDQFNYTIAAPTGTAIGTVTISVAPSNPVSVSFGDTYNAAAGQALIVEAPGPLANDAAGPGAVTMIVDDEPDHGTLDEQADGSFVYQPTQGYTGPDSFIYHAVSALGASNPSTVTIAITQPTDLVVTTTADSGAGSLRQAMMTSLVEPGSTIRFDIPDAMAVGGVFTIQPQSALPTLNSPVVIDGYTQPGSSPNTAAVGTNAVIKIAINGSSAGSFVNGLYLQGGNSTVRGLAIGGFSSNGIQLDGLGSNVIEGNFIGTNAAGTAASANAQAGVSSQSTNNQIGTASLAGRNLISGNGSGGIRVSQRTTGTTTILSNGAGAVIVNNLVGTSASGLTALANGLVGITVSAPNVTIGGTSVAERNVISGNGGTGVASSAATVSGVPAIPFNFPTNLVIQGNFIGVRADGSAPLANTGGGVYITGANSLVGGTINTTPGACTGACNVISGNTGNGVGVATQFENPQTTPNAAMGTVYSQATGTQVVGNFIGINPAGTAAMANSSTGVYVTAPSVTVASNIVGGNNSSGISFGIGTVGLTGLAVAGSSATGSIARANSVGFNAAGTALLSNSQTGIFVSVPGVTIGGANPGDGNYVIGGGPGNSAAISTGRQTTTLGGTVGIGDGTVIQGNVIGVFPTGGARTSVRGSGISINSSTNQILGNIVAGLGTGSAPFFNAINVSGNNGAPADNNVLQGNVIGTNAAGASGLGNPGSAGFSLFVSSGNTIGGATAAERNIVVGSETGLFLSSTAGKVSNNNVIKGNHFGVKADGLTVLANNGGVQFSTTGGGIVDGTIFGGSAAGERNIIASTVMGNGLTLYGSGTTNTVIRGNYIGVGGDGTTPRGNASVGVYISDAVGTSVGGPAAADGNVIANNSSNGVVVSGAGAIRNSIRYNRIFANGSMGIDLGSNGTTNNDAGDTDTGPNNLQNFPVLSGASNSGGGNTTINADLSSFAAGETFTVQFFVSNSCTTRQGELFAGSATLTSAGGTSIALNQVVSMNQHITATATDALGNTSEFSACVQVQLPTVVTNLGDSGAGSLRDVLTYANSTPGAQTITFNIPGVSTGSPGSINLTTALPPITEQVTIDGTTQPGYTNAPAIELNGLAAAGATGLTIQAAGVTVKALAINRFPAYGINVSGGNNFTLTGSYVGLSLNGQTAAGNGVDGVVINATSAIIGGPNTTPTARNVISGNGRDGVHVTNTGASGNTILGNFIGTNVTGTAIVGNTRNGVTLEQSTDVTVGGNLGSSQNLISGNGQHGVHVFVCDSGHVCNGHLIEGNRIGTDINGNVALRNNQHGVYIEAAPNNTVKNNLLSGNTLDGVNVYSNSLTLTGNQTIIGNLIGTQANGSAPLANQRHGVAFVGPVGSRLGGPLASDRNTISHNGAVGVDLENTTDIIVQGNHIGVSADGTSAAGNSQHGVLVYSNVTNLTLGGASTNLGNVISSNGGAGVLIGNGSHDNVIRNNLIGWDSTGTTIRGNNQSGIYIDGSNNTVQDNRIANNGVDGVRVFSGVGNRLTANRITGNTALGIDLGNDGVTTNDPNDADTGPNNRQNYPSLASVSSNGNDTIVVGTLNSTPSSPFTLEFFESQFPDANGFGEGARYLAQLPANTDGSGNLNFAASMTGIVTTPGWFVTATATDAAGNTSEFSLARQVDTNLMVVTGADSGTGSLRNALDAANSTPGTQNIRFGFPNTPALITLTSSLPQVTESVVIDATTQAGYTGVPVIEVTSATPGSFTAFTLTADNVVIRGLSITRFATGIYGVETRMGSTIEANIIGSNGANGVGLGNTVGIDWRSNTGIIRSNVISGNVTDGLVLTGSATGNGIESNKIGVGTDGVLVRANAGNGVSLYNGPQGNIFVGNIISGNSGWGVNIQNVGNAVYGTRFRSNRIGVDANGNDAGNFGGGLRIENAGGTVVGEPGLGNIISGNGGNNPPEIGVGILVLGNAVPWPSIRSNYIGLDPTGISARSNNNKGIVLEGPAIVGGNNVNDRNYISGNGDAAAGAGIMVGLGGGGATIWGNVIGLNVYDVAVGNGYAGITVRSTSPIQIGGGSSQGNVLSGNGKYGIAIQRAVGTDPFPSGAVIQGNRIGTDMTETIPLPNGSAGIYAGGNDLFIGGAGNGIGNVIANNGGLPSTEGGIRVIFPATGVRIERNSIYQNAGLGIDLDGDGLVNPNDPGDTDGGPNKRQNFPVLSNANNNTSPTQVTHDLSSFAAGTYTLDFYATNACDAGGNGEGKTWVGSTTVSNAGPTALSLNQVVPDGSFITATATDALGNTSEFSACAQVSSANPLVVTNTSDSGTGSLRGAMTYANSTPGSQTITFNIPGAGPGSPAIITPVTALPALTDAVVINGASQPGYDAKPVVEIRNASVTNGFIGFDLEGSNVTIRGLAITQFAQGIFAFQGYTGHTIELNTIGTNRSDEPRGNSFGMMWRASNSVISNNLISGNAADGLSLIIGATSNNVHDNTIGLASNATSALPNGGNGVTLYDAANNNTIDNNLISGNGNWGIDIQKGSNVAVAGTIIKRNTIGLDTSGNVIPRAVGYTPGAPFDYIGNDSVNYGPKLRGNLGGGVRIDTAPGTIIGQTGNTNRISGNTGHGLVITGDFSAGAPVIQANLIGTDASGTSARGNTDDGISIEAAGITIGGTSAGAGNTISGNLSDGIRLPGSAATNARIEGNRIGTSSDGTLMVGNGRLQAAGDPGCCHSGIQIDNSTGVIIGGATVTARNIISGNHTGIWLGTAPGIRIENNVIGRNAALTASLPNKGDGGIAFYSTQNPVITKNYIAGNTAMAGVFGSVVNGALIDDNDFYENTNGAIRIHNNSQGNTIRRNRITNNGWLGIDLQGDGPTANDPGDTDGANGPNRLQNFPVLQNASNDGAQTHVGIDLSSLAVGTYTVEVFASPVCDASGFGEGSSYVGGGLIVQPGNGDFALDTLVQSGWSLTATATDAAGNTSEFSACTPVPPSFVVTNANPSGAGSLRAAIEAANATPGSQTITFNIPGASPSTPAVINLSSALPVITGPVTIDARTQPGYDNRPVIEIAGNNQVPYGFETGTDVSGVTIRGFAITGFSSAGIFLLQAEGGASSLIRENYIGTDRNGSSGRANGNGVVLRADNSYVDVNVISGNLGSGVVVEGDADSIRISGNTIGVLNNGVTALGNTGSGIVMYDSPNNALIDANIIANNSGWGIDLQDTAQGDVDGTLIRNNAIGVYGNNPPAGNAQGGIKINHAVNTTIGGFGNANTIAYNGGAGIAIVGNTTAGVRIDNNPIHHNTGLGIDLDNNGVTANDPGDGDSGPNTLLNYPEFSGVTNNSYNGNTFVTLDTSSLPAGYNNVNFFKSQTCDASGFGEGEQVVMRFGIIGQSGPIQLDLNQVVPPAWFVTATVMNDATGNTSEFSLCLPVGLVSHWAAEGNASDTLGVHNGTLQGASFATGRFGQAFSFNGTNASVDLGNWFTLQTFTIDMWVKADASQAQHADIIDNNHTDFRSWNIQYANVVEAGKPMFGWGTADAIGEGPTACCIGVTLTPGEWQHLVITRDAANLKRLYLDGVLIGQAQGTAPIPYDGTEFFRLGRWGGGGRFFTGLLDEVRVFDRALSAGEVTALYNSAPVTAFSVSGSITYAGNGLSGVTVKLVQGQPTDPPLQTTTTLGDGTYQFLNVSPGTYWLRADGPNNDFIPWGANQVTVVNANVVNHSLALPKRITLLSPSGADITAKPTLTWTAIAEATRYVIQINHTNTWNQIDAGAESLTNSYTVQTLLTGSENYTWQVDGYDAANRHVGSTTNAFTFTVIAPLVVNVAGTSGGLDNPNFTPTGTNATLGAILANGQKVWITATGGVTFCNTCGAVDPNGWVPNAADGQSLAPGLMIASLVASINGSPWSFVGTGPTEMTAVGSGVQLLLAVNDNDYNDNGGSWTVTIQR